MTSAIAKYEFWRVNFPEQVAAFEKQIKESPAEVAATYLEKGDEEEADEYIRKRIEEMRRAIAAANTSSDMGGMVVGAAFVVQSVAARAGLRLDGPKVSLADIVAQQQAAYSTLLKEIACKHGGPAFSEPETRMGMLALSSIAFVHMQNSSAASINAESAAIRRPPAAVPSLSADQLDGPRRDNMAQPVSLPDCASVERAEPSGNLAGNGLL